MKTAFRMGKKCTNSKSFLGKSSIFNAAAVGILSKDTVVSQLSKTFRNNK